MFSCEFHNFEGKEFITFFKISVESNLEQMAKFSFSYLNNLFLFSNSEILFSNMGQNKTHEFI